MCDRSQSTTTCASGTTKRCPRLCKPPYSSVTPIIPLKKFPWEKGAVEKINQMIRRFIAKGTNIAKVSERKISRIQEILNGRPYKCLGFYTPAEIARRSPKLTAFVHQTFQRSKQFAMIS